MMDKCQWCGSKNIKFTLTPNLTHYGRNDCIDCKNWVEWLKNPETKGRSKTSKYKMQQLLKFYKMDNEFCFFCLRTKSQLGIKETLTIDHKEELNKGGKDEVENLQILCSACHKLKNWCRLYLNWHLMEKIKE